MSDFASCKDIKAVRKPHECQQCGREVSVGSPARYSCGRWDGYFFGGYTHIECHNAAHEYATDNGLWGEEYPWFQHMDDREHRHHGWLLEKHPVVAERLRVEPQGEDAA